MTNATVTAPVAESSAATIAPRAIYITGYDPAVFPTAVPMSVASLAPTLYVGADIDTKPYRPPVFGRRGWRVAIGPPILATPSIATASAAAVAPLPQVSLASLIVPRAVADVAAPAPQASINFTVNAPAATADTSGVDAAFGEYRNPYVVDAIATATTEAFLPTVSASTGIDQLPVATASAATSSIAMSLSTVPDVAAANAAALDPTLARGATVTAGVATSSAAAINPTVAFTVAVSPTVTVPVATATAAAVNPTAAVRSQVTYKGAATAVASSVAIPAHNAGDLIVIWAYQNNGSTLPTKPAASGTVPNWTDITTNNAGANYNGRYAIFRTAWAVATSSSTTTGTWSGADVVMAVVLSGQAASPIGGADDYVFASNVFSIDSATAPSITMSDTTGTSQLLHFLAFYISTSNGDFVTTPPSGYTSRQLGSGTYSGWRLLTKNSTTSDGPVTSTLTTTGLGASGGVTIEILAQ